jgi:hypothetical protein
MARKPTMRERVIYVESLAVCDRPRDCDDALALRFRYDPRLVDILKEALRDARTWNSPPVGGWLPALRCWFVEVDAWPDVRKHLLEAGYELDGLDAHWVPHSIWPRRAF